MRVFLALLFALSVTAADRPKPVALSDNPFVRGRMTFAGFVVRCTPERLTIHTQKHGIQVFVLRRDTAFLMDGTSGEAADLDVNTRVFVRAGESIDQELEAYQVVWGKIVQPLPASR
jgi:hypothetical protein